MRQKMPFIVIGLLVGIVVMQLAMPAAQSQTGINLRVNSLTLVDENDETTAMLFNGTEGPILALGESGKGLVIMGAEPTSGNLNIYSGGQVNPRIIMGADPTDAGTVTISMNQIGGYMVQDLGDLTNWAFMAAGPFGGKVYTAKEGKVTDFMPGESTAAKPVTWGQIKRDPTPDITAARKPIIPDLQHSFAAESRRMMDEYSQKRHSLR